MENIYNQKKEKIKNIEFFRILFILQLVIMHFAGSPNYGFNKMFPDILIFQQMNNSMQNGHIVVEFFFIIAGFFLVLTYRNLSFVDFVKNKFIRLFPLVALGIIIIWIANFINWGSPDIYKGIFDLLFVQNIGLSIQPIGFFWFVSVLFWVLLFYYYIIKNYERKNVDLAIGLITFFSYCLIMNYTNENFADFSINIGGFLNVGLLRGLAGIGLGYFLGNWYKDNFVKIKNLKFSMYQKLIASVIEGSLLFYIIFNLSFYSMKNNRMILIFAFLGLFIMFLLKQGIISRFLDNNVSLVLGRYAFSLYIMDCVTRMLLGKNVESYGDFVHVHPLLSFQIMILILIIFAIASYHLIEQPAIKYLKKMNKNERVN